MVTMKSSLLKLFTKTHSVILKSSLLKLLRRESSGYIAVITSKAVDKGA